MGGGRGGGGVEVRRRGGGEGRRRGEGGGTDRDDRGKGYEGGYQWQEGGSEEGERGEREWEEDADRGESDEECEESEGEGPQGGADFFCRGFPGKTQRVAVSWGGGGREREERQMGRGRVNGRRTHPEARAMKSMKSMKGERLSLQKHPGRPRESQCSGRGREKWGGGRHTKRRER